MRPKQTPKQDERQQTRLCDYGNYLKPEHSLIVIALITLQNYFLALRSVMSNEDFHQSIRNAVTMIEGLDMSPKMRAKL